MALFGGDADRVESSLHQARWDIKDGSAHAARADDVGAANDRVVDRQRKIRALRHHGDSCEIANPEREALLRLIFGEKHRPFGLRDLSRKTKAVYVVGQVAQRERGRRVGGRTRQAHRSARRGARLRARRSR